MNTSLAFIVHFLSFSRNISVQLVWKGLDVAGDIVAVPWIPRATVRKWYANSVYLCDPIHKNYAQKCFFLILAYKIGLIARICISKI